MKKLYFLFLLFFSFALFASAQPSAKYFEAIDKAKISYDKKEFKKSAQLYSIAFKQNGGKAYLEDRYNAARSWALVGNKDSSFAQLFKVVKLYDYLNFLQISKDADFAKLYNDKRWTEVLDLVKENVSRTDTNLNKGLVILLDSVYRDHHSYRLKEVSVKNEFGTESIELAAVRKMMKERDSVNLSIVTNIIDKYGWLGRNVVGFIGNYTIALIISQADIKTQEKYLPLVREAFKNKNVEAYDFAFIEDILALREGKKQSYGSVIVKMGNKNYVAPIEDAEHVDKRRADLGLKSMNSYLMSWKIKWDISKYKKDLLLLEKEKVEY